MKERFARWNSLLFHYIKRDWQKILIWIVGIGLFAGGFVAVFEEIAKEDGLVAMFETLRNPALTAMVGPTSVETAAAYTLGAMYAHEMLLFCSIIALVVSALHVIGHTRKEEDLGLSELVRSFPIGRQANSFAVIVEVVLVNGVLALFIASMLLSFGAETISPHGSFLFGASIGMAGMMGAAIALVMAQLMPTSSAATGASLGVVGLLYIVRAGTDISNVDLSMLNPLGWTYLTFPFTENNWLPIVLAISFTIILLMIAFILEGNRDLGAGYFTQREGRKRARRSLLSIPGILLKLNQGTIISWLIAFIVLSVAYGSVYGDMQIFLESNEMIQQLLFHTGISLELSFTSTIIMVMIGLVAILPIAIVNKLYTEETRSHLSQVLATKITRGELFWTSIGLAILSGIVAVLFVAISLGGTALAVMEASENIQMFDFLLASFNQLPAVLFFISLAALALGWVPKLGKVVYVYLTLSFILTYFQQMLELPTWFLNIAVHHWLPQMPVEDFDIVPFISITVVSVLLIIIGSIGYNRRDMDMSV